MKTIVDQARDMCRAPDDARIIITDYVGIAFPVMHKMTVRNLGELDFMLPFSSTFGQVKVEPKRRMAYGYRCGYNREINTLVIHRPPVDSVEAPGL